MKIFSSIASLGLSLACASPLLAQQYTIEDLGTLSATPTDGVRAAGINNRGHVHGENDRTAPGGVGIQQRSFWWAHGLLTQIAPPVAGSTWKGGLNDGDVCVGNYTFNSLDFRGYSWDAGVLTSMIVGVHNFTKPTAINADGFLAGTFVSITVVNFVFRNHAFVSRPDGVWLDLGSLGGMDSYGAALNDRNDVVGNARDQADVFQAFLWSRNNGMAALSNLAGRYTEANDINNFKVVVGRSKDVSGNFQATRWNAGAIQALPSLGGLAATQKPSMILARWSAMQPTEVLSNLHACGPMVSPLTSTNSVKFVALVSGMDCNAPTNSRLF